MLPRFGELLLLLIASAWPCHSRKLGPTFELSPVDYHWNFEWPCGQHNIEWYLIVCQPGQCLADLKIENQMWKLSHQEWYVDKSTMDTKPGKKVISLTPKQYQILKASMPELDESARPLQCQAQGARQLLQELNSRILLIPRTSWVFLTLLILQIHQLQNPCPLQVQDISLIWFCKANRKQNYDNTKLMIFSVNLTQMSEIFTVPTIRL